MNILKKLIILIWVLGAVGWINCSAATFLSSVMKALILMDRTEESWLNTYGGTVK